MVRSVIYFGPKLSILWEKAWAICFFLFRSISYLVASSIDYASSHYDNYGVVRSGLNCSFSETVYRYVGVF